MDITKIDAPGALVGDIIICRVGPGESHFIPSRADISFEQRCESAEFLKAYIEKTFFGDVK